MVDKDFNFCKINDKFFLKNKESKFIISAGSFDRQKNFLLYNTFKNLITKKCKASNTW